MEHARLDTLRRSSHYGVHHPDEDGRRGGHHRVCGDQPLERQHRSCEPGLRQPATITAARPTVAAVAARRAAAAVAAAAPLCEPAAARPM